jgi:hypothetical protein
MKPMWAAREVFCYWCKEPIYRGNPKWGDFIRQSGRWAKRVHFHPVCHTTFGEWWWNVHPYQPPKSPGRKPMPITEEARVRRKQLLTQLSYLKRYYLDDVASTQQQVNLLARAIALGEVKEGSLEAKLQEPKANKLRRLDRYTRNVESVLERLAEPGMGGVPRQHQ